jgi:hypothetical protein
MLVILFFMLKGNYNLVENMTLQEELSNSSTNSNNAHTTKKSVSEFSNILSNSFNKSEPFIESMSGNSLENFNYIGTQNGASTLERIQNINNATSEMNRQKK